MVEWNPRNQVDTIRLVRIILCGFEIRILLSSLTMSSKELGIVIRQTCEKTCVDKYAKEKALANMPKNMHRLTAKVDA